MDTKQQTDALRLANVCSNLTRYSMDAHLIAAELRRQHARIAELEAQLSSSGFTAADMATAESRGFRDGAASLSASAPAPSAHIKEPYTVAEIKAKIASHDYSAELLLQHAMALLDSASLAASAGSEPVAWPKDATEVREFFSSDFISAEYVADDRQPCDEDRYYISAHDFLSAINWWADFPHHPSPPEGMVREWISVQDELPKCSKKPDSFGVEVLIWPPHEDGSRTAFYGRRQSRDPNFYKYGALLGHVEFWRYPPLPPTSAEGVEHG